MNREVGFRLGVVLALVVIGVGAAAGASALGVAFGSEGDVAVTVGEDAVVVSNGDTERVAVDNLTGVSSIEITGEDGQYTIQTERQPSFTDEQRDRAADLVRASDRVPVGDGYNVSVEPIERLDADDVQPIEVENVSGDGDSVSFGSVTATDDSVTIDREPSYVPDQLNVRVHGPNGELLYSVVVDLSEDAIVDVTAFGGDG